MPNKTFTYQRVKECFIGRMSRHTNRERGFPYHRPADPRILPKLSRSAQFRLTAVSSTAR